MRIVVVYLGLKLPRYVLDNVRHLSRIFPYQPKTLVVSQGSNVVDRVPLDWDVTTYIREPTVERALARSSLESKFRGGFWQLTLERLIAIEAAHRDFPESPLLQIEADNFLMPNFPFEKFERLGKLAWLRADDTEDIATLIYSPSMSETSFLTSKVMHEMARDTGTSDMRALRAIREAHPEKVAELPISPNNNEWGGIFDPITAGVWLLGNDPRNQCGLRKTGIKQSSKHLMPIEDFTFSVNEDCLFVSLKDVPSIPLWNLHIHAKRRKFFELSGLVSELRSRVTQPVTSTFHLDGFLQWAKELARDLFSWTALARLYRRANRYLVGARCNI